MSLKGVLMYDAMMRSMSGGIGKYYNVPSFDAFKKSNAAARPTLKPGYTRSTARIEGEGVDLVYSQNPKRVVTSRGIRNNYPKYGMSQGTYIYKTPVAKAASASSPAAGAAAAPLQQLQISQASKDYRAETEKLLTEATKARDEFKASEAARVQSQAVAAANQARSATTANLQIQPASKTEAKGGTSLFKKRSQDQFMTGISGMVNI